MPVGLLTIQIHLPGCLSLKEKRSRLKPLLARLRREFNVSVAEMDYLDVWQDALIACAVISNDKAVAQNTLSNVSHWIEGNWHDVDVIYDHIELI
jgi:hypothetical protein